MPKKFLDDPATSRCLLTGKGYVELAAKCALIGNEHNTQEGRVTLVGAGPGDPDLLTVKAVKVLQSADVVLFDDLVSQEVLELARATAHKILVGKRGGRVSCRQDEINAAMLVLAKKGLHVVRLKSGDPMIFGRAGEEIEALRQAGIDVEIVPGITASLGAASSLKVSLTHRDHAQAVKFITAHSRKGELPDMDWRACADGNTTLILYMGGRTAPMAAEKLLGEGLACETPVVVMWSVSRPDQRHRTMYLRDLADTVISTEQPVIVCIGHVFANVTKKSAPFAANKASCVSPALAHQKQLDIASP